MVARSVVLASKHVPRDLLFLEVSATNRGQVHAPHRNFGTGYLQVRATFQRTPEGLTFADPKTAYSRRTIALSRTAMVALRQNRARQLEERLALGEAWHDLVLVFANEIGKPLEAGNVLRRSLSPLLKRAELPHMRFHDLRHTAATLLLGRGINPQDCVRDARALAHLHHAQSLQSRAPHVQQQAADAMDAALGE